ncbi:hypothetical protein HN784_05310 [bacterium]|jgi:hypothetical protein|nr:hypothetical protein [bacterium]MBT4250786.1 hypothetical protein [bacterium]MBT4598230.1 hypothetical protein [bacterium]MBT6753828.1 hypothetical protein [bacterium]MBT7037459.1 hypothetical protein [bacterium]
MSKGHRAGGKMASSHTTVIPAAGKIIDFLSRQTEVKKISVGFIKHGIKSGRHSLKITKIKSGLFLKIRGTASIQELWVYTDKIEAMKKALEKNFN